MRSLLAALLLVAGATPSSGGAVLDRRPFPAPAYAEIPRVDRYASPEEYAAAVADRSFRLEKLTYASDGLAVHAYLYAPADCPAALPTVVFNRGSFVRQEFAGEHLVSFHRLARAGFAVLAPAYRGSAGSAGADEMGGADLADLAATVELARELPCLDEEGLLLYGESRGGMMALQALRDGYPARAAAVYGAFTDLGALLAAQPALEGVAAQIWPDFAVARDEIVARRSAVRWAEAIRVPLLILHGGADGEVSPTHALALASRLEALGRPYELHVRAGAGHVLAEWREERDRLAVEWFRRHLAPPAAAD